MTRKLFLAAVAAASLLLAACGSTESGTLTLKLEHLDCLGRDVIQNASYLEVIVSGPGMEDVYGAGDLAHGGLDLGEIPAGKDRVATVRATNGPHENAALWAIGRSAPFKVVADQDAEVLVTMIGLNQVHPTATASNECTTLSAARAGHSSAALSDGRVLVVGGFVFDQEAQLPKTTYLDTVEMYEPATGGFRSLGSVPPICGPAGNESCARAFAPALVQTTNKGERVLVIGGEYRDEAGNPWSRGEILVFDPANEEWTTIKLQQPRRHHTATLLDGTVFIVGGLGNPATAGELPPVVAATEFLEKNASNTAAGKVSVPRAFHGAAALGKELYIAGGLDEARNLPPQVLKIIYASSATQTVSALSTGVLGTEGVIGPSLTIHARRLAVIGGIRPDPTFVQSLDVLANVPDFVAGPAGNAWRGVVLPLEGVQSAKRAVGDEFPLKVDRSFACTARIDDNRFLVAGGLTPAGQVVINNSSAEVLTWVDQSVCVPGPFDPNDQPTTCSQDTECSTPAKCASGKCRLACTSDAVCGAKGTCVDGYCQGDVENPAHRCSSAGASACFAGSKCVEDGKFDQALIGGSSPASSQLIDARAWAACTKLSPDQILITGGVSGSPDRSTIGSAEIYEITHAGR